MHPDDEARALEIIRDAKSAEDLSEAARVAAKPIHTASRCVGSAETSLSDARTEIHVTSQLLISPLRDIAYTCIFLIVAFACSGVPPATNIDEGGFSDSGVSATDATQTELDAHAEMMPDGASTDARHDAEAAPHNLCNGVYGLAEELGRPTYNELIEVSGIAASRLRRDRYWLHNDSGHGPILYSVDGTGEGRGKLTIDVPAVDWEDIAIAQCPGQTRSCIWIADIGDNHVRRQNVFVYVVPEPADGDHQRMSSRAMSRPMLQLDARFLVSADGSQMDYRKNNDGLQRSGKPHTCLGRRQYSDEVYRLIHNTGD